MDIVQVIKKNWAHAIFMPSNYFKELDLFLHKKKESNSSFEVAVKPNKNTRTIRIF